MPISPKLLQQFDCEKDTNTHTHTLIRDNYLVKSAVKLVSFLNMIIVLRIKETSQVHGEIFTEQ